uniref:Ethylene insensitive 3-like DNA-binding domain-containing protein n=1 Tax=Oryza barthii TaxID=65489 RepID=A0A0D3GNR5_9ORYZ
MASSSSGKRVSSSSTSSHQQHAKRRRRAPGDELSQTHGVARNAVAAMPMVGVAPLMLSPVTMQAQLLCYVAMPMAPVAGGGGGGVPLAAALCRLRNGTLERMVREMAQECTPPLVARRDRKSGATPPPPPPWWPKAEEPWWGTEVAAHLRGRRMATPVPFASPRRLAKAEKVAVLVAVVRHVAPDFGRLAAAAGRVQADRARVLHMGERAPRRAQAPLRRPEPESADQTAVDFSVSGEDTVTTGPELEQLVGDGNGATVEGEGQKTEDSPVPPLLEQHGGEDHDHHRQHGGFSGEVSGAAPEDVDWFDYDEVLRGLDELEIPSFFGGYYI